MQGNHEQCLARRLRLPQDEALFQRAFSWGGDYPPWLRQCEAVFGDETWQQFLDRAKDEKSAHVGLFEEGQLAALITLAARRNRLFEASILAPRHTRGAWLSRRLRQLARPFFAETGARFVFAWCASHNRPMRRRLLEAGFRDSGERRLKGTRGRARPIEWMKYILEDAKESFYGPATHTTRDATATIPDGSGVGTILQSTDTERAVGVF